MDPVVRGLLMPLMALFDMPRAMIDVCYRGESGDDAGSADTSGFDPDLEHETVFRSSSTNTRCRDNRSPLPSDDKRK
jgi:hypothetical protein